VECSAALPSRVDVTAARRTFRFQTVYTNRILRADGGNECSAARAKGRDRGARVGLRPSIGACVYQRKLLHTWVMLVIVKKHLVQVGRIDGHTEYSWAFARQAVRVRVSLLLLLLDYSHT